ncbi:MAG: prolyl oligopeptidase family serine peptidase [Acidobacteriota bacterium]|nr:prolyl oligopeptidase family serine peptidase [Acidobacteriota bacterium]
MCDTTYRPRPTHRSLGWFLIFWLLPVTATPQPVESAKPTVPPDTYGRWEMLDGPPEISSDGRWLAYQIQRVDREHELRVRALDGDIEHVASWGQSPEFSANGEWIAWIRGVPENDRETGDEEARTGAGLLALTTGDRQEHDAITQFAFDKSGQFLALLGFPPAEEPETTGADLLLLDLSAGTTTTFGNVTEYAWSEVGSQLAFTLRTRNDTGNGVQVFDPTEGRLRTLETSRSTYRGLAWREMAADLAFLRSLDPAGADDDAQALVTWQGLDATTAQSRQLPLVEALERDEAIVRHRVPRWSDDGRLVAFGIRPTKETYDADMDDPPADSDNDDPDIEQDEAADEDDTTLPALQIWHSTDVRLVPEQQAAEDRDARRTLLAVWHLNDDTVIRIGTELSDDTELLGGWKHGVERTESPYPWGAMFGRPYHDVWLVETDTGVRSKVLERERYVWESAGGRYLLTFDGDHFWSVDLVSRERHDLTSGLGAIFRNQEYDTPTDRTPPYGVGGWFEDDASVLLYSRFDVWRVTPDGSGGTRLTDGVGDQVVHRVIDLHPDADTFDPKQPLYFSLRNEQTEQRGFARREPGDTHAESLLLEDKWHGALTKARDTDVFVFRTEARDDSADFFVAGPDLSSTRQVTATNPFQDDYAWTRSELLDFESETGVPLQAALLYPAVYDPAIRYPMIVYTYEIQAPQIHRYEAPDERDYYNFTAWTQHGYFVLLPDIVYRARAPGLSALEAVRPAVEHVVDRGVVDRERVGLIGHSWGGYQATFLSTRTDLFAASVAGAPLTDFVSFMGQIHWTPGVAELSHWETGQARMEVPFWEDPDAHRRASPIHRVHEMETPLLMAFGDDDGVVDWDQGTEFYNFARRAGKQMVLLVYEEEGHGFRAKANQIDYHRRILEWFGHYLKGARPPAWITDGVPLSELEAEKRRVADSARRKPQNDPRP